MKIIGQIFLRLLRDWESRKQLSDFYFYYLSNIIDFMAMTIFFV